MLPAMLDVAFDIVAVAAVVALLLLFVLFMFLI